MNIKSIKKLNKKGVIGLDTVKSVFVWFLVISVLAIAIILSLTSIRTPVESIATTTNVVFNETISDFNNITVSNVAEAPDLFAFRNSVCSSLTLSNTTSGANIEAANFTINNSGCSVIGTDELNRSLYNGTNVFVSYTSVFSNPETNNIIGNISLAFTDDFFDQTGTIFAILIVIVIILAIAIIIAVVTRFGGTGGGDGGGGGFSGGGARGFGGNTLTGS